MTTNKRIASPNAIFRRRLVSHWSYQRSNIGAVVDWVIMLYILIPGLLLGIGLYRDFLTRPLPAWIELIPFQGRQRSCCCCSPDGCCCLWKKLMSCFCVNTLHG